MKKCIYLLIVPTLIALTSCGNKYPHHKSGEFCNVTFIGHDVSCDCPSYTHMDRDLDLKLNIPFFDHEDAVWEQTPTEDSEGQLDKPVQEYAVSVNDIKVLIGGKEYPDSWCFYYRHNDDNLLKIKKEYVVDDITIDVTAHPFGDLFLYGIVIGDELWHRWIDSEEEISEEYPHDLQIDLATFYQSKPYPIKTLSGQKTFPVLEHDNVDITFEVTDQEHPPLPNDIRLRSNARYAAMGTDYTREYSNQYTYKPDESNSETWITGYQTCHLVVPHYIVMDHISFRQFGTE
ncbi:MAG: hypothetical protein MJ214_01955 [Bacilli bacterium]|nr:hypothetical protein [Bacilli bacterium]